MTVTVTTARKDYTGDGSTTAFTFDFKILSTSDLLVENVVTSSGAVTTQILDTDYTVSFDSEGGTVTYTTAPASTVSIVITRKLDTTVTQANDFIAGTALSSNGLESILDKIVMSIHDLRREVDRCIKIASDPNITGDVELPEATLTAGYGVAVNDTADGFTTVNLSSSGTGLDNIVEDLTPQLGANLDGQGFQIDDTKLKQYTEVNNSVSSSSNATTIDLDDGRVFTTTLTENTTMSFTNVPSGVNVGFRLFLTQDSTARTVTWPGAVIWDAGITPDLTTTSSKHLIIFETVDGGTTWYGSHAISNAA